MELPEIQHKLHLLLKSFVPPLRASKESDELFQVCGTQPVTQGKQTVHGFYFASVVFKPKDIRFYFFLIYTYSKQFATLSLAV